MQKIIGRGAEAILIHKDGSLIKRRIRKGYRIKFLDEKLRKFRTRSEAKLISKASSEIAVPKIFKVDDKNYEIKMDFIDGKILSMNLDKLPLQKSLKICEKIGKNMARIHDLDLIHGDLTTSNMILNKEEIFFIDFGLGFHSKRIEDKAVDLHLLKQALESKHFKNFKEYFNAVLKGYEFSSNMKKVLEQFKKVESRGRYRGKH
ncbi:Kae1-associated kinase Bud32 [Candidatus Pacearchaeota archaeon CG06_land_8_20_14_3_00_35_12]|nr:MAG: Kae1-associated kinase Bud32 [Candidatus Pacearchaeota archaeon CG06_land_8_20_14_3_00_35_12]